MLQGFGDYSAYALCTFAYCEGPGHEPIIFEGKTDGKIVLPRGPRDFGWDCAFQPDGYNETYVKKRAFILLFILLIHFLVMPRWIRLSRIPFPTDSVPLKNSRLSCNSNNRPYFFNKAIDVCNSTLCMCVCVCVT